MNMKTFNVYFVQRIETSNDYLLLLKTNCERDIKI